MKYTVQKIIQSNTLGFTDREPVKTYEIVYEFSTNLYSNVIEFIKSIEPKHQKNILRGFEVINFHSIILPNGTHVLYNLILNSNNDSDKLIENRMTA